jgi:hypothetical protein
MEYRETGSRKILKLFIRGYPLKLALSSLTGGDRSIGIVR